MEKASGMGGLGGKVQRAFSGVQTAGVSSGQPLHLLCACSCCSDLRCTEQAWQRVSLLIAAASAAYLM